MPNEEGAEETYMYYAAGKWWIEEGGRERMEAGVADGWMHVTSDAMTPDAVTAQWRLVPFPWPLMHMDDRCTWEGWVGRLCCCA
jgi:hypothetical protein